MLKVILILLVATSCVTVRAKGLDSLMGKRIWYMDNGQVQKTGEIDKIIIQSGMNTYVYYDSCVWYSDSTSRCNEFVLELSGTYTGSGWKAIWPRPKEASVWATTREELIRRQRVLLDSLEASFKAVKR